MSVRLRTPTCETPDVVIQIGWRDFPMKGSDACEACCGWGTLRTDLEGEGADRKQLHRTCPSCKGRGWVDVGACS